MKTILNKLVVLVFVMALPVAAFADMIGGIAAVVNGDPITTFEVDKEAALINKLAEKKPGPTLEKSEARSAALNQLIEKKLISLKIKELDVKVAEEEVRLAIEDVKKQNNLSQEALVAALNAQGLTYDQYRAQVREQMERVKLMSEEVRSKIQVGEAEMKAYYDANYKPFNDELFQARHIFFALLDNAPPDVVIKVMTTATTVLHDARGGMDFAALAQKYSDDQLTAKDGGDLGTFKKGEMQSDIEKTLATMKPGEISELVKTPAGIHIIKLEKKYVKSSKTFDEVKGEIEEIIYKKKSEERFKQWATDLKKNATIDIR